MDVRERRIVAIGTERRIKAIHDVALADDRTNIDNLLTAETFCEFVIGRVVDFDFKRPQDVELRISRRRDACASYEDRGVGLAIVFVS